MMCEIQVRIDIASPRRPGPPQITHTSYLLFKHGSTSLTADTHLPRLKSQWNPFEPLEGRLWLEQSGISNMI